MIAKFPYSFTTVSGHQVVVSNPEIGKYVFAGTTKEGGVIDFKWYSDGYKGKERSGLPEGALEYLEHEILHAFWQLER